jgi:phosphoglycolate phosphatase
MDGTLLNTLEDLKESINFALLKLGFNIRTKEEVRLFVGNGVRMLCERAVPDNTPKEIVDKCEKLFKEHYFKNLYNNTAPYNGIIEILRELKRDGVKIAVVSNKFDKAVKTLCDKYFKNLIEISVGQSEEISPKPSPDGVLKVMKELNSKNAVMVGDSDVDIQTAINSKIPSIGVKWGFRENLNNASVVVNSPNELIKAIRSF